MEKDSSHIKNIMNILIPISQQTLFHPFSHCRILMQLGYEPNNPYYGHTFQSLLKLGPKVLKYPSVFAYSKSIARQVGLYGLFCTGLPARICYMNLSAMMTEKVYNQLNNKDGEENTKLLDTDRDLKTYLGEMSVLAFARISGVLVSYPFEVVMIRQMAEVIEDSGTYSNMFKVFQKIFKEEGIGGYYGGVGAKIVGEVLTVTVAASLVYVINRYLLTKQSSEEMKDYVPTIANVIANQFTYKFNVMSTLLAVANSELLCAVPLMGFRDSYSYLKSKNGFSRGSSLFLRYAN